MQTEKMEIRYPPGFERAVHLTKDELEQHIRLMAALKMFELGKVSSGKAAELAGMSRPEFLEACGRYRVSVFNYPPEEIERELKRDLRSSKNCAKTATGFLTKLSRYQRSWPRNKAVSANF